MQPETVRVYETHRVTKWLARDDRVLELAESRGLILQQRENLFAAFSENCALRDKGKYIFIKDSKSMR